MKTFLIPWGILFFVGTCPDPSPENGFVANALHPPTNGRYPDGRSVRLGCNSSYVLDYDASDLDVIRCESGRWYPPPAKCVPMDEGE